MKGKIKWQEWLEKGIVLLRTYKFVLIVILVGIVLLLLPFSKEEPPPTETVESSVEKEQFDLAELEQRLAKTLSQIEGAGEVEVMLTVKGGSRQILAQDGKRSDRENSTDTVILSKGSGVEDTVLLQQIYPTYQGALIVCDGGDDPAVRLRLIASVSALTGLGADKISVCKSK